MSDVEDLEYLKAIMERVEATIRNADAERLGHLQAAEAKSEEAIRLGRDLSVFRTAAALISGQPTELLPAEVKATDDPLSLTVGALKLVPDPQSAGSLRKFAAVNRVLYEVCTHLAVVATRQADALAPEEAHVRRQALTETQQVPAFKAGQGVEVGLCKHCNAEVYHNGAGWLHHLTGIPSCTPGESLDFAEPLEAICTCTDKPDPWCSEHKPTYPTQPAVGPFTTIPDGEAADA